MYPVSENKTEPPGVSGLKVIQQPDTGLFHLECCLTLNCTHFIINTILSEMVRQNQSGKKDRYQPNYPHIQPDSKTGLARCEIDIDLNYLKLIVDALAASNREDADGEFDVCISYSHNDREYVDGLVTQMRALGIRVWHDQSHIRWGDHHRTKMDYGLRHSKFCIVVCSPSYFAQEKYWTHLELNGAYQGESIGSLRVLPLLHNMTPTQLHEHSRMLASKDHLDSAHHSPLEIAVALLSLLHPVSFDAA